MRSQTTTRRGLLAAGVGLTAGLMMTPFLRAAKPSGADKISLGFIGVGARGTELLRRVLAQRPEVQVPAICDIDSAHLTRALDLVEKSRNKRPDGFDDYRRLLARDDLNAILIATPQDLHAQITLDSFAAGKFVGAEVPACTTLDECFALIRAQRKTGAGYMMLENYLYTRHVMQVWNMAQQNVFGDLTYAAGAYIHDVRSMRFTKEGKLTWRGENVAKNIGVIYPTHAMGPVCRWLGIGKTDRLKTLVAIDSKQAASHAFAVEKFGAGSDAAKVNFANGDTNHALIRTEQGRLIEIRYDTASPRPNGMGQLSLQGSRGAFESVLGQRKVYLEGASPSDQWEDIDKYQDKYDHPMWRARAADASKAGHGGGDFFVIEEFLSAIQSGKSPIDIVDAITWTCVRPLSAQSIKAGYAPVEVPDFSKH